MAGRRSNINIFVIPSKKLALALRRPGGKKGQIEELVRVLADVGACVCVCDHFSFSFQVYSHLYFPPVF